MNKKELPVRIAKQSFQIYYEAVIETWKDFNLLNGSFFPTFKFPRCGILFFFFLMNKALSSSIQLHINSLEQIPRPLHAQVQQPHISCSWTGSPTPPQNFQKFIMLPAVLHIFHIDPCDILIWPLWIFSFKVVLYLT